MQSTRRVGIAHQKILLQAESFLTQPGRHDFFGQINGDGKTDTLARGHDHVVNADDLAVNIY